MCEIARGSCVDSWHVLQVAFQQADYVAWNLWSAINNRPLLPFKYQHLGDMMSLGTLHLVFLSCPCQWQLVRLTACTVHH